MTQRGLAGLAGVSLGTVRDIEQGRSRQPRAESVRRLVAVLPRVVAPEGPGRPGRAPGERGEDALRLAVLGPLQVWWGQRPIEVRSTRQRTVLALLALAGGQPVPRQYVIDAIWPERAPAGALHRIETYVWGLRHAVAPDLGRNARHRLIPSERRCYRVVIDEGNLDLVSFRNRVRRARDSLRFGDAHGALSRFGDALQLWRGPVLADVDHLQSHPSLRLVVRERLAATVDYADVGLSLGAYREILPVLSAACDLDPLNGALGARLMRALAGSGQQVAALRFFESTRRQLVAELGVDPDPELAQAHTALLSGRNGPRSPVR